MIYERASSACICDDDGGVGTRLNPVPRVYSHVMFRPGPSQIIAEFAHLQLHSARARVNGLRTRERPGFPS